MQHYPIIVIGGGHNGLVNAGYLAKAGLNTLVLERRHLVGGAAITEEVVPGFKFTTFSYALSLLRPQIVQFRTGLTSDLARVVLGNSITLTPGTITMDIDDDEFTVHAISDQAARSLRSGEMERRVGHVFLEPDDPASTNDVSHF